MSAAPTVNIDAAARGGLKAEIHPLLKKDNQKHGVSGGDSSSSSRNKRQRTGLAPMPKFSTIKVNRSKVPPAKKSKADYLSSKDASDPIKNPYFDPNLIGRDTAKMKAGAPITRKRKQFNFVEEGKYTEKAEHQRAKAQLEELRSKVAEQQQKEEKKKDPESELVDERLLRPSQTPEIEWWDIPLLSSGNYEDSEILLEGEKSIVSHLIQHPIRTQSFQNKKDNDKEPVTMSLMLTKKERKKLRRQRRMEEHKERQEKIRLGLLPPDPPKVRLANLMRVLGQEAVQDPTKVEAAVREQVASRRRVHNETNASRQLTTEQKQEKVKAKIEADATVSLCSAVFKVNSLTHPQHKFKVETNTNQLGMTGVIILNPIFSLVVVEGGAKSMKAFKKLMLRRINWTDSNERNPRPKPGEGEEEEEANTAAAVAVPEDRSNNQCNLVWEGETGERRFKAFKVRLCPTEDLARTWLARAQVEQYWDVAKQFDPREHDTIPLDMLL